MHHNIKKEKCELNLLSANLNCRNNTFLNKNISVQRPDSLEIKVRPDSIVSIISKADTYLENVNSWSGDNLDNFILQIKNANNTPSPVTPNSFFNPSDVTQDQEQFADALTIHLNKIKEDYKSSIDTNDSSYLSNLIQISSGDQDKPIPIATVSLGNKVFLLNQINHNHDQNESNCLNYGVTDVAGNISLQHDNQNSIMRQPIKISQLQSLRPSINQPTIFCSGQNVQFASYTQRENGSVTQLLPISNEITINQSNNSSQQAQHSNYLKTSEGIIYTRLPDSTQNELLNQLNSLTNNMNRNNGSSTQINPNVINGATTLEKDFRCLSASSNENDSSYGTNDSSIKAQQNGSRIILKEDMDDIQRRLERKRARNRDAARKCRDRKNSLIITLEQKYARQCAEKDLIRDKLLKSLEEIKRLSEYISKHDPLSKCANFSNFLSEIKIHELTETDLKDLNLI